MFHCSLNAYTVLELIDGTLRVSSVAIVSFGLTILTFEIFIVDAPPPLLYTTLPLDINHLLP